MDCSHGWSVARVFAGKVERVTYQRVRPGGAAETSFAPPGRKKRRRRDSTSHGFRDAQSGVAPPVATPRGPSRAFRAAKPSHLDRRDAKRPRGRPCGAARLTCGLASVHHDSWRVNHRPYPAARRAVAPGRALTMRATESGTAL